MSTARLLFHVQTSGAKTYGTFSIDATGAWSYTLDDDNADVQALNTASTPLHDLITVSTADGTRQLINITINGANDAAVITGTATGLGDRGLRRCQWHARRRDSASGDLDADRCRQLRAVYRAQSGVAKSYGTFSIDAERRLELHARRRQPGCAGTQHRRYAA